MASRAAWILIACLSATGCGVSATVLSDAGKPAMKGGGGEPAAGSVGSDAGMSPLVGDAAAADDAGFADVDAGDEPDTGVRTLYWGDIELSVPGFNISPSNTLTLAFDAESRLRYLSWKDSVSPMRTFGPAPNECPWHGAKHVERNDWDGSSCDVTVEAGEFTTSTFRLSSHFVCTDGGSDYVESIEGTRTADGWHVVYAEHGNLYGTAIDAHAKGDVGSHGTGEQSPTPGLRSVWLAPIATDYGKFPGVPYDLCTVTLDGEGKPLQLDVEHFQRHLTYGTNKGDLPYSGSAAVTDENLTATVEEFSSSASQFIVRHRTTGMVGMSDYVEELSGSRSDDELVIRYFMQGKYRGQDIDMHAQGTLYPTAENAEIAANTRWNGKYTCHADTLSTDGCTIGLTGAPWTSSSTTLS